MMEQYKIPVWRAVKKATVSVLVFQMAFLQVTPLFSAPKAFADGPVTTTQENGSTQLAVTPEEALERQLEEEQQAENAEPQAEDSTAPNESPLSLPDPEDIKGAAIPQSELTIAVDRTVIKGKDASTLGQKGWSVNENDVAFNTNDYREISYQTDLKKGTYDLSISAQNINGHLTSDSNYKFHVNVFLDGKFIGDLNILASDSSPVESTKIRVGIDTAHIGTITLLWTNDEFALRVPTSDDPSLYIDGNLGIVAVNKDFLGEQVHDSRAITSDGRVTTIYGRQTEAQETEGIQFVNDDTNSAGFFNSGRKASYRINPAEDGTYLIDIAVKNYSGNLPDNFSFLFNVTAGGKTVPAQVLADNTKEQHIILKVDLTAGLQDLILSWENGEGGDQWIPGFIDTNPEIQKILISSLTKKETALTAEMRQRTMQDLMKVTGLSEEVLKTRIASIEIDENKMTALVKWNEGAQLGGNRIINVLGDAKAPNTVLYQLDRIVLGQTMSIPPAYIYGGVTLQSAVWNWNSETEPRTGSFTYNSQGNIAQIDWTSAAYSKGCMIYDAQGECAGYELLGLGEDKYKEIYAYDKESGNVTISRGSYAYPTVVSPDGLIIPVKPFGFNERNYQITLLVQADGQLHIGKLAEIINGQEEISTFKYVTTEFVCVKAPCLQSSQLNSIIRKDAMGEILSTITLTNYDKPAMDIWEGEGKGYAIIEFSDGSKKYVKYDTIDQLLKLAREFEKTIIRETPKVIAAKKALQKDLENLGLRFSDIEDYLKNGLITIQVDEQTLTATVSIAPSVREGKGVNLANPLGSQGLPGEIYYTLGWNEFVCMEPGCGTAGIYLSQAKFEIGTDSYELRYGAQNFLSSVEIIRGNTKVLSIEYTAPNPLLMFLPLPIPGEIGDVVPSRWGSLDVVKLTGHVTYHDGSQGPVMFRDIDLALGMDNQYHISAVRDITQDRKLIVNSVFSYAVAMVDYMCAEGSPCVAPPPMVMLANIERTDAAGNNLSSISNVYPLINIMESNPVMYHALVILSDGKESQVTFAALEELLKLANEFENTIVRESPALKSVKGLLASDLAASYGLSQAAITDHLAKGLIKVTLDEKTLKAVVTIDSSVKMIEGTALFDLLGDGTLPDQIIYQLSPGLQMGAPCTASAEGGISICPPPNYQINSAHFQIKNRIYDLNYLMDETQSGEGGRLVPEIELQYGDNRIHSISIHDEDTGIVCVKSPCPGSGELLETISFEYLDLRDGMAPSIVAHVKYLNGSQGDITSRDIELFRMEDGQYHIQSVSDFDQDGKLIAKSKLIYATAIPFHSEGELVCASCLLDENGNVAGNCPCAFVPSGNSEISVVTLAMIQRFDAAEKEISHIQDIWDGQGTIVLPDGTEKRVQYQNMNELLLQAFNLEKWRTAADINGDGNINSADVTLILKHSEAVKKGEPSPLTPDQLKRGSLDRDPAITYADARILQLLIIGSLKYGDLPVTLGDNTGNGTLSSMDVSKLLQHIDAVKNGKPSPLTSLQQKLSDMDGDGQLTDWDVTVLQRMVVGIYQFSDLPVANVEKEKIAAIVEEGKMLSDKKNLEIESFMNRLMGMMEELFLRVDDAAVKEENILNLNAQLNGMLEEFQTILEANPDQDLGDLLDKAIELSNHSGEVIGDWEVWYLELANHAYGMSEMMMANQDALGAFMEVYDALLSAQSSSEAQKLLTLLQEMSEGLPLYFPMMEERQEPSGTLEILQQDLSEMENLIQLAYERVMPEIEPFEISVSTGTDGVKNLTVTVNERGEALIVWNGEEYKGTYNSETKQITIEIPQLYPYYYDSIMYEDQAVAAETGNLENDVIMPYYWMPKNSERWTLNFVSGIEGGLYLKSFERMTDSNGGFQKYYAEDMMVADSMWMRNQINYATSYFYEDGLLEADSWYSISEGYESSSKTAYTYTLAGGKMRVASIISQGINRGTGWNYILADGFSLNKEYTSEYLSRIFYDYDDLGNQTASIYTSANLEGETKYYSASYTLWDGTKQISAIAKDLQEDLSETIHAPGDYPQIDAHAHTRTETYYSANPNLPGAMYQYTVEYLRMENGSYEPKLVQLADSNAMRIVRGKPDVFTDIADDIPFRQWQQFKEYQVNFGEANRYLPDGSSEYAGYALNFSKWVNAPDGTWSHILVMIDFPNTVTGILDGIRYRFEMDQEGNLVANEIPNDVWSQLFEGTASPLNTEHLLYDEEGHVFGGKTSQTFSGADGKILGQQEITLQNKVPLFSALSLYDASGLNIVGQATIDYSNIAFDDFGVMHSGFMGISTFDGTEKLSEVKIKFENGQADLTNIPADILAIYEAQLKLMKDVKALDRKIELPDTGLSDHEKMFMASLENVEFQNAAPVEGKLGAYLMKMSFRALHESEVNLTFEGHFNPCSLAGFCTAVMMPPVTVNVTIRVVSNFSNLVPPVLDITGNQANYTLTVGLNEEFSLIVPRTADRGWNDTLEKVTDFRLIIDPVPIQFLRERFLADHQILEMIESSEISIQAMEAEIAAAQAQIDEEKDLILKEIEAARDNLQALVQKLESHRSQGIEGLNEFLDGMVPYLDKQDGILINQINAFLDAYGNEKMGPLHLQLMGERHNKQSLEYYRDLVLSAQSEKELADLENYMIEPIWFAWDPWMMPDPREELWVHLDTAQAFLDALPIDPIEPRLQDAKPGNVIVTIDASAAKVTVNFDPVFPNTAFNQVQISTDPEFKDLNQIREGFPSGNSETFANLEAGKSYYVRVRSALRDPLTPDNVSQWSDVQKISLASQPVTNDPKPIVVSNDNIAQFTDQEGNVTLSGGDFVIEGTLNITGDLTVKVDAKLTVKGTVNVSGSVTILGPVVDLGPGSGTAAGSIITVQPVINDPKPVAVSNDNIALFTDEKGNVTLRGGDFVIDENLTINGDFTVAADAKLTVNGILNVSGSVTLLGPVVDSGTGTGTGGSGSGSIISVGQNGTGNIDNGGTVTLDPNNSGTINTQEKNLEDTLDDEDTSGTTPFNPLTFKAPVNPNLATVSFTNSTSSAPEDDFSETDVLEGDSVVSSEPSSGMTFSESQNLDPVDSGGYLQFRGVTDSSGLDTNDSGDSAETASQDDGGLKAGSSLSMDQEMDWNWQVS